MVSVIWARIFVCELTFERTTTIPETISALSAAASRTTARLPGPEWSFTFLIAAFSLTDGLGAIRTDLFVGVTECSLGQALSGAYSIEAGQGVALFALGALLPIGLAAFSRLAQEAQPTIAFTVAVPS